MGVIQSQTIKGTFYSYLGVVIGFINLAVLSPKVFSTDQIGLTQVMLATATILAQIGSLGFNNVTNRLFPYFRNSESGHNGFISLGLLITISGFLLSTIALLLYLPRFEEINRVKSALLSEYAYYIPILLGMIMFFTLLDNFCKVLFNAVIGIFLKEFLLRVINLALILLFLFGIIDFKYYISLFVISQVIPALIIVVYLLIRREFRITRFTGFIDKKLLKEIASLCLFGILAGLSGIALTTIDKIMVNNYEGLGNAGIYSISVYFATLILIPARTLGKITVPVVAEAWKRNDMDEISMVYRKSSINQFIMGLLILVGIFGNIENIFRILPEEYRAGEIVILFFGIANLINVSVGASQYILGTSSMYRFQTYLMIVMIILVILTNITLIPPLGMAGAALGSLISMFIYTLISLLILKYKYGLWPFSIKHIFALIVSIVVWSFTLLIPEMRLIPDIIIRSGLITILFLFASVKFRLSEEVVTIWNQFTKKDKSI